MWLKVLIYQRLGRNDEEIVTAGWSVDFIRLLDKKLLSWSKLKAVCSIPPASEAVLVNTPALFLFPLHAWFSLQTLRESDLVDSKSPIHMYISAYLLSMTKQVQWSYYKGYITSSKLETFGRLFQSRRNLQKSKN